MKKLFVIALMLLYGASSFGLTLYIHFCCGKVDAVSLAPVKKNSCPEQNKMLGKSCCSEKEIGISIKDVQQQKTDISNVVKQLQEVKPILPAFDKEELKFSLLTLHHSDNSPPVFKRGSFQSLYCIYRI